LALVNEEDAEVAALLAERAADVCDVSAELALVAADV
jgi:hypothetical protein